MYDWQLRLGNKLRVVTWEDGNMGDFFCSITVIIKKEIQMPPGQTESPSLNAVYFQQGVG